MMNIFPVRNWSCWLAVLSLMALMGCSRSLDVKITEKTLKEELAKQGVGALKQVSCPEDMKVGQNFTCIGIFESGIGFKIPVKHKGENDKLVWEVPTIKGMLNMNQVLNTIQTELKLDKGAIDCGTSSTYRMATLGSSFECVITASIPTDKPSEGKAAKGNPDDGKAPKSEAKSETPSDKLPPVKDAVKPMKEPDKIEIAIAASGDVTWQRMIAGDPKKAGQIAGAKAEGKSKEDSKAKSGAGKSTTADEEEVPYDS
jgi:hypothetical protein